MKERFNFRISAGFVCLLAVVLALPAAGVILRDPLAVRQNAAAFVSTAMSAFFLLFILFRLFNIRLSDKRATVQWGCIPLFSYDIASIESVRKCEAAQYSLFCMDKQQLELSLRDGGRRFMSLNRNDDFVDALKNGPKLERSGNKALALFCKTVLVVLFFASNITLICNPQMSLIHSVFFPFILLGADTICVFFFNKAFWD